MRQEKKFNTKPNESARKRMIEMGVNAAASVTPKAKIADDPQSLLQKYHREITIGVIVSHLAVIAYAIWMLI